MSVSFQSIQKGHIYFIGALFAWLFLFHGTITTITDEWSANGHYSHGFLAFAIASYIFWEQRGLYGQVNNAPNYFGLLGVLGLGLCWWLAVIANILLVQQIAILGLFGSFMLAVYGWRAFKRLQFPLLIIFLAMPIWNFLRTPLRDLSTVVSYQFIQLTGIPVLLEGYLVTVPGGQFSVEEACSGLSFFLAALSLSVLFAYFNGLGRLRAIAFIIFALATSIIANWVRIIVIMLVGNATRMNHPIIDDHLTFGWIVFSVTLVPLFWLGYRYFLPVDKSAASSIIQRETSDSDSPALYSTVNSTARNGSLNVGLAVAGMALFPILSASLGDWGVANDYGYAPPNLAESKPFLVTVSRQISWQPRYVGADSNHIARYNFEGVDISLYIANYQKQAQGKELIYVKNRLFESYWKPLHDRIYQLAGDQGRIRVLELVGPVGKRKIIAYWYKVGGLNAVDGLHAKLYEVLGALRGNRGASVFALNIDFGTSDSSRYEDLIRRFAEKIKPLL